MVTGQYFILFIGLWSTSRTRGTCFAQEIECHNDYEKNCFIEYKKSSRVVEVRVCHKPFVRNCGKTGPNVCTDEYQTGEAREEGQGEASALKHVWGEANFFKHMYLLFSLTPKTNAIIICTVRTACGWKKV